MGLAEWYVGLKKLQKKNHWKTGSKWENYRWRKGEGCIWCSGESEETVSKGDGYERLQGLPEEGGDGKTARKGSGGGSEITGVHNQPGIQKKKVFTFH